MKILSLSLLLFCLVAIAPAQLASTRLNTDQPAAQDSRSTEPFYFKLEPDHVRPDTAESFCAYMRTYRVKRTYRDSDVVSPAGYTTCVPSKRFELHSAVQVQTEAAPRE